VLDDAHGFGVLGRQGRGTVDHFKMNDKVDILCGRSPSPRQHGRFRRRLARPHRVSPHHSKQTLSAPPSARAWRRRLHLARHHADEPQHSSASGKTPGATAKCSRPRPRHVGQRDARRAIVSARRSSSTASGRLCSRRVCSPSCPSPRPCRSKDLIRTPSPPCTATRISKDRRRDGLRRQADVSSPMKSGES